MEAPTPQTTGEGNQWNWREEQPIFSGYGNYKRPVVPTAPVTKPPQHSGYGNYRRPLPQVMVDPLPAEEQSFEPATMEAPTPRTTGEGNQWKWREIQPAIIEAPTPKTTGTGNQWKWRETQPAIMEAPTPQTTGEGNQWKWRESTFPQHSGYGNYRRVPMDEVTAEMIADALSGAGVATSANAADIARWANM